MSALIFAKKKTVEFPAMIQANVNDIHITHTHAKHGKTPPIRINNSLERKKSKISKSRMKLQQRFGIRMCNSALMERAIENKLKFDALRCIDFPGAIRRCEIN